MSKYMCEVNNKDTRGRQNKTILSFESEVKISWN